MKIYFLSSKPCALYVGGVYFGLTNGFERFAEIALSDNLPVTFAPERAQPVHFFLSERLRFEPPAGCEVYLLPDAIAVYAYAFPPVDFTLRPIAQAKENGLLATVFQQGNVQLSVERNGRLFTAPLSDGFSQCGVQFVNGAILLCGNHRIAVYSPQAEKWLEEEILDFSVENGTLTLQLPLSGKRRRTAKATYEISETACRRTQITLQQDETAPRDGLLAYAFFQSVLLGLDTTPFLSDELKAKAGDLTSFLGDFLHVLPTDEESVCRLVYEKKPRLFDVREYEVTIENGEIGDIRLR